MALTRISTDQIAPGAITTELLAPGAGAGPVIANVQIANSSYNALDDTAVALAGGFIILNGSNFGSNTQVIIGNTLATSVTYVSSSQIRAQVPARSAGSYIVYLVNQETGATAIRVNGLTYSGSPSWSTGSTLTEGAVDEAVSIQLSASSDSNVSYQLQAGSTLPTGLTLAANGLLSGTVTGLNEDTLYNFTIEAVDAENQDSPRSFSITITAGDEYINSVVLALNADTNTFITDASNNNFAITPNGDTRPSAFSPYNTSWSNFFDGTGDYLTIADNTALRMDSGDFTVEFWINFSSIASYQTAFSKGYVGAGDLVFQTGNGNGRFIIYASGSAVITESGTATVGEWVHYALVRNSTTLTLYRNGVSSGSATNSTNLNSTVQLILGAANAGGGGNTGQYPITGYMSNVRVIKGTAVYTSNFTPPSSPLTAISGTSLLTCQSNRLIDNSTNNFTITRNGDVRVSPLGPFAETDTTTGSGYFDGTGDYLTLTNNAAFKPGSSESFCVELWFYPTSVPGTNTALIGNYRVVSYPTNTNGFDILHNTSNKLAFRWGYPNYADSGDSATVTLNAWNHVVVCRNTNLRLSCYLNGTRWFTATTNINITDSAESSFWIGWAGSISGTTINPFLGYISNTRLVKGSTPYDPSQTTITPPTSPLTAIANTSLLTLQNRTSYNNNQPVDESGVKNIITRAGNASVGSYTPHTPAGWSAYFDGTGDYLNTSYLSSNFGTGDFTLEAWIYNTVRTDYNVIFDTRAGATANPFGFGITPSGYLYYYNGTEYSTSASGTIVPLNTWTHFAIARSGTTVKIFQDGVEKLSRTDSSNLTGTSTTTITIGRTIHGIGHFFGYISNLRVVKGSAVYTSNFTPSTTPLEPITNTSLLTLRGPSFTDDGPDRFAITSNGDTRITPFSPFKTHTIVPDSYSVYFDGTDDHFTIADSENLQLGSGNFTAEGWFYPTKSGSPVCFYTKGVNTTGGIILGVSTSVILLRHTGQTDTYASVSISGWNHIAWVRNGNTISIFVNGVAQTVVNPTVSFNQNDTTTAFIGSGTNITSASNRYGGYASNFRIVKGTALYTSNFTPSTTPLTKTSQGATASEVELLTCQSSTITDNSDNNFTLTVINQPQPSKFNPFGETITTGVTYSPASHGGSYYFDGTGDYLNTPATGQFAPAGAFTIECFVYITSLAAIRTIIGNYTTNATTDWMIDVSTAGVLRAYTNGSTARISSASGAISIGEWEHIVLSRNSSNVISLFLNGVLIGTYSQSGTFGSATKAIYIGVQNVSTNPMLGYISNLRMVEGSALYTSAFVPPAAPPSPVVGTTLLLNGTGAAIADGVGKNVLETIGTARQVSDTKKFGTGSIHIPATTAGFKTAGVDLPGDFTIEFWVLSPITGGENFLIVQGINATNGFLINATRNAIRWRSNGTTDIQYVFPTNNTNWYHVAIVRNGSASNNVKVYYDGNSVVSGTYTNQILASAGSLHIGPSNLLSANFMGYGHIDDFRVTAGVARYTSNFTPPTSSFKLK